MREEAPSPRMPAAEFTTRMPPWACHPDHKALQHEPRARAGREAGGEGPGLTAWRQYNACHGVTGASRADRRILRAGAGEKEQSPEQQEG